MRLAGDFVLRQVNTFWPQYPAGSFRFSSGLTSLPGIVNTGHGFASFLMGMPEYAEASVTTSPSYFRHTYASFRVGDQYEPHKGLTISIGLNLTRHTPRTEKYNRQSTVDLSAINPANGRLGALVVAGQDGAPRAFQPIHWNLNPSASIAWNPDGGAARIFASSHADTHLLRPVGHAGIQCESDFSLVEPATGTGADSFTGHTAAGHTAARFTS
jgi:hypothetical protein